MYTSKTPKNVLLQYVKEFVQKEIFEGVASQPHGPLFGNETVEVTEPASIEQLE